MTVATQPNDAGVLRDMPGEVLDGWLGEVCRTHMSCWPIAWAWPALLGVASAMVVPQPNMRVNLYTALVGRSVRRQIPLHHARDEAARNS